MLYTTIRVMHGTTCARPLVHHLLKQFFLKNPAQYTHTHAHTHTSIEVELRILLYSHYSVPPNSNPMHLLNTIQPIE